jgi:Acetyltransferase (GNAT) domain
MTGSGGTNSARDGWERARVPLKLQLGDVVLGKVCLSLFRRNGRLDERPLEISEVPEAPAQLDGADGFVVWSHPLATRLPILTLQDGLVRYSPRQYERFSIDLSGSFERYMAGFSGKTRSGFRRKLRKFAETSGGTIDWRQYRTPEELAIFFDAARTVSAKTYQERLLRIGLPNSNEFVTSSLTLSKADNVRAYLLFLMGRPISYLYCSANDRVVAYDYLGYDPTYSSLSPGTVLQLLALEALFAEQRFATFDFTEGEGQHKKTFSTASCLCGDVYVLGRRFVPMSRVMLHYATDRISAGIGAALDRFELRPVARRLVRRI